MMNGHGKSDRPIVPTKLSKKTGKPEAEAVEGRGLTKGNTGQQNTPRTQGRIEEVPSALERVRKTAARNKKERFTALLHHVTVERLCEAFYSIKKKAKAGIDGMTWEQYEVNLEKNLQDLHSRLQRGAYRAKPSRRAYIPKSDGHLRPLGIAVLEDKIVQHAEAEVLSAIYETDFLGFSYGFRPGRRAHEALDALAVGIRFKKVSWILDGDIQGYFDTICHEWMVKFIEHRILSNIYLHYVLDLWAHYWREHKARGDVIIVRWADDFVVGFQYLDDAQRFHKELRERFGKFSLKLHPEKTRIIRFGRFARRDCCQYEGRRKPETFDFLGFTHI